MARCCCVACCYGIVQNISSVTVIDGGGGWRSSSSGCGYAARSTFSVGASERKNVFGYFFTSRLCLRCCLFYAAQQSSGRCSASVVFLFKPSSGSISLIKLSSAGPLEQLVQKSLYQDQSVVATPLAPPYLLLSIIWRRSRRLMADQASNVFCDLFSLYRGVIFMLSRCRDRSFFLSCAFFGIFFIVGLRS